jgi:hypothetical protein
MTGSDGTCVKDRRAKSEYVLLTCMSEDQADREASMNIKLGTARGGRHRRKTRETVRPYGQKHVSA